jgi:hypothetical protein
VYEPAELTVEVRPVVLIADATYFGHRGSGFASLVFLDVHTPQVIAYMHLYEHEATRHYRYLKEQVEALGFTIQAVVIDGRKGLIGVFEGLPETSALSLEKTLSCAYSYLWRWTPMPNGWIESMFPGIMWYNLKTLRKNLQKIFDAILKIRPVFHRKRARITSHICIAFRAYGIYKELERRLYAVKAPFGVEVCPGTLKNDVWSKLYLSRIHSGTVQTARSLFGANTPL